MSDDLERKVKVRIDKILRKESERENGYKSKLGECQDEGRPKGKSKSEKRKILRKESESEKGVK